jgi:hypothetical protein
MIRTGPSATSAAYAGRQARLREPPSPTETDPPIHRTSSVVSIAQDTLRIRTLFLPYSLDGVLLGTLLRDSREQCTNFSLPITPVPPQRTDGC